MKKILLILILPLFIVGCGSVPVKTKAYVAPPKPKHLDLQQVMGNVQTIKTEFDKFEKYETTFFEFNPGYGVAYDKFLLRGWEGDNNTVSHQIYIRDNEPYEGERPEYEKQISGVKFIPGKLGGSLEKIKMDKTCKTTGGRYIAGSVNKYNPRGRNTRKVTTCRHYQIVGINVTTDMLKSYRNSSMKFQLTSKNGDLDTYSIPAVYINGYLKALGL